MIVLKEDIDREQLSETLSEKGTLLKSCQLIKPSLPNKGKQTKSLQISQKPVAPDTRTLNCVEINDVKLLNPKLAKKERQKNLALWLMPFGFIAGLAFSEMTGLRTFENLGFSSWSETFLGGVLGMTSGLIGSFAAAGSSNEEKNKDLQNLRKRNESGKWLLILETPAEIDLPWGVLNKINPIEIVRIDQL